MKHLIYQTTLDVVHNILGSAIQLLLHQLLQFTIVCSQLSYAKIIQRRFETKDLDVIFVKI